MFGKEGYSVGRVFGRKEFKCLHLSIFSQRLWRSPSTRAGLIRALQAENGLPLNYHFRTRLAIGRPTAGKARSRIRRHSGEAATRRRIALPRSTGRTREMPGT